MATEENNALLVVGGQLYTPVALVKAQAEGKFGPMGHNDQMAFLDAPAGSLIWHHVDEDYDISYTYIMAPAPGGSLYIEAYGWPSGDVMDCYTFAATISAAGVASDWDHIN